MAKQRNGVPAATAIRLPYRLVNSGLGRLLPQSSFTVSPEQVIARATRVSGVIDPDCREFEPALRQLCKGIADPNRTPVGRILGTQEVIGRVVNRLNIERAVQRDPGILDEAIAKPWFIIGAPRTGTTYLHRLLSQDTGLRAPLYWETVSPIPLAARDTPERRIARARAGIGFVYSMSPGLKAKHPMEPCLPEECVGLLANSLLGGVWLGHAEFRSWLSTQDSARAYELHKIQLQYLQRRADPIRTWVLKAPQHAVNIDRLLKVYPDARIIQTHRDPVDVVASGASLLACLDGLVHFRVDLHEVGRRSRDFVYRACHSPLNTPHGRASLLAREAQLIDVRYTDLVRDPLAVVRTIYRAFDRELTEGTMRDMRRYLQANLKNGNSVHRYTAEQFGLDRDELTRDFASYSKEYLL